MQLPWGWILISADSGKSRDPFQPHWLTWQYLQLRPSQGSPEMGRQADHRRAGDWTPLRKALSCLSLCCGTSSKIVGTWRSFSNGHNCSFTKPTVTMPAFYSGLTSCQVMAGDELCAQCISEVAPSPFSERLVLFRSTIPPLHLDASFC